MQFANILIAAFVVSFSSIAAADQREMPQFLNKLVSESQQFSQRVTGHGRYRQLVENAKEVDDVANMLAQSFANGEPSSQPARYCRKWRGLQGAMTSLRHRFYRIQEQGRSGRADDLRRPFVDLMASYEMIYIEMLGDCPSLPHVTN